MRNQCWNQQGQLIEDLELTRVAGVATVIDHITGTQRPSTLAEQELLIRTETDEKKQAAKGRAIANIKANAPNSPWGTILYDLAVAQGLIEPE